MRFSGITAVTVFALSLGIASAAGASTNLVSNGSFDTLNPAGANSAPSVSGIEVDGAFNDATAVTGWTSAGGSAYNIYFYGNGKEAGGASGIDAANRWGENGQRPNVNFTGDSPDGGAYMVLDADPGFSGAFSQTVGGLTVGQEYELSFYWAGGELYDRTGFQTTQLTGTFGTSAFATPVFTNSNPGCNGCVPAGDFSGWKLMNFTFIAQTTSQTLTFLAAGTPTANLPPVAFLDGVSLTAVPESAVWWLMVLGFGGVGSLLRRRRVAAA